MSLSEHFPPSTQAVLAAQLTPPKRKRTLARDHSIISISSSPLQPPSPQPEILDSSDDQYFAPARPVSHISPPIKPRKRPSHQTADIQVLEDDSFTRLLDNFKYDHPAPFLDTTNSTRHNPKTKTNLDGFFQERKQVSQNRVKQSLKPRLSLSKATKVSKKAAENDKTVEKQSSSFLTTWAAELAPVIRPAKASAKPRRKPMKKKDGEVVLLSPRTAQKCASRSFLGQVDVERRLGEKREGGMWDVCKRGLEGELYDEEGGIVFSQELRAESRESKESSPEIALRDVEVIELESTPTTLRTETSVSSVEVEEPVVTKEVAHDASIQDGPPARRKQITKNPTNNGMPLYSTFTLSQLQNEIKKFGFKASKSKPAMISVLEECYLATQKPKIAPQQPDISTHTPSVSKSDTADLSSPALLLRIHKRITETIKTEPEQSVYLGILRYEPVVVEDLMEWLKERGIDVPEIAVRGWCDKEGVCSVARESLTGGRRARY